MQNNPYQRQRVPLLIVISGLSGVGKDTVVDRMKSRHVPFHFVITTTTRPPRPDETPGVDYFFVSVPEFEAMIEGDELIEYAFVYQEYKGVPKDQVRQAFASGLDVIMRLDVQGAATIRRLAPEAILVFLVAGSEEEMIRRLRERQSDSEEAIRVRLAMARQELERIGEFDYLVVNPHNQVDTAVDTILAIIAAEHSRVNQRQVEL
jgi:guanylate kinase